MSYPVTITKLEFEAATNIQLSSRFGSEATEIEAKITKFLNDVIFYTFENAIYAAGERNRVDRLITAYPATVAQIKEILYKVGEYMLENENYGLQNGVNNLETGSVELKDMQEIIARILPPNIMTYVMNIRPSLVYAGGYR